MGKAPEHATVVVGVKGTGSSRTAIKLAAQEARYRGAALVAVMAYSGERALGTPAGRPLATPRTADDDQRAAESALQGAVVDALGDEASGVEMRTVPGLAGRSLVETARTLNADLVVLAGRGSAPRLNGTASQYVLRRAPCPVLVVPQASASA